MNQGITPYNTLASIALFIALTLGCFFLLRRTNRQRGDLFLGLILLYLASFFLQGYLWGARVLSYFPHCVQFGLYTSMALGPLIYLYIRAKTEEGFRMRPVDYLHFVPLVLDILVSMPHILTPGPVKAQELEAFLREGIYPITRLHAIIKAGHIVVYFALAVRLVFFYRQYIQNTASSGHTRYYRWLLFFSIIVLLPILMMLLSGFTGYRLLSLLTFVVMLTVFLIAIYVSTLVLPEVFHAFPDRIVSPPSREKYEYSNLDEAQKDKLLERLQRYMTEQQPHRAPELSIGQLSEQLHTSTSYLSQVINERLGVNFVDFINGYRVADAKRLLHDPAYAHYAITALGYEAGFNSKSTFYTAFKRFTKTTPGKFRQIVSA